MLTSRQTKVCQLKQSVLVDEKILRLQVTVQHLVLVALGCAREKLE